MGPKLTQAEGFVLGVGAKMFSCCGARCAPCRRRGCVAHRPRPLARLLPPAIGGSQLAPHRRAGDCIRRISKHRLWIHLLDNANAITKGITIEKTELLQKISLQQFCFTRFVYVYTFGSNILKPIFTVMGSFMAPSSLMRVYYRSAFVSINVFMSTHYKLILSASLFQM